MRANGLNHRTTFLPLAPPPRTFLLFYFFAFLCIIGLAKFDQIWTNEYDFIAKALSVFCWALFAFPGTCFRDQKKPSRFFLRKKWRLFLFPETITTKQKWGEVIEHANHRRRQPEGWRRKDDHLRQLRHWAGPGQRDQRRGQEHLCSRLRRQGDRGVQKSDEDNSCT